MSPSPSGAAPDATTENGLAANNISTQKNIKMLISVAMMYGASSGSRCFSERAQTALYVTSRKLHHNSEPSLPPHNDAQR